MSPQQKEFYDRVRIIIQELEPPPCDIVLILEMVKNQIVDDTVKRIYLDDQPE